MTGSGVIRHLGGVTADYAIAIPPYGAWSRCFPKNPTRRRIGLANRLSEPRHLQWAFSRRSCAAFLCLYFSLQALLFVKRTLSGCSLIEATGPVPKGNAVAELTRKVIAEKIKIERTIYASPHMAGDALRRSTIALE
jgi:hypothetical protein